MKRNRSGFTLMEMLIVIALIAVLIAIAIPVFASQLEKSREATDLANVRAAYAQVSTEAQLGNFEATVTVDLKQKQADWQSVDPVNIGGIVHYKTKEIRIIGRVLLLPTGPVSSPIVRITELFLPGMGRPIRPGRNTRLIQRRRISSGFYTIRIFGAKCKRSQTLSLTPDVQIRNMFRPLPRRSKSWITVFCSSRAAPGLFSAAE